MNYVDRTAKNYDNAELTPGLRRVVPEWHEKATGQVNFRPAARELSRGGLEKRTGSFAKGEIEILIATLQCTLALMATCVPDLQV